jgi:hypothetical protein
LKTKLLLFFILILNISAQNDEHLYQNIFHENILANKSILKNSINIINEEAKLNPELVYYSVKYFNELYGNKNSNAETNGKKDYSLAKSKYFEKRNNWVNSQLKMLRERHSNHRHYSSAESFFEDLLLERSIVKGDFTNSIDTNEIHFFSLFYYSNKTINKYDHAINYYKQLKVYLNGVKNEMQLLKDMVKSESDISAYDVEEMIEDKLSELMTLNLKIDLAELLLYQVSQSYKSSNLNQFDIGIYYRSSLHEEIFSMDFVQNNSNDKSNIGNYSLKENFAIELSYRYFLKEEIDLLSYLDFGLSYVYISKNINLLIQDDNYARLTISDSPAIKEFYFVNIHDVKEVSDNLHKFQLNILTPFLVFSPKFIEKLEVTTDRMDILIIVKF